MHISILALMLLLSPGLSNYLPRALKIHLVTRGETRTQTRKHDGETEEEEREEKPRTETHASLVVRNSENIFAL